MRNIENTQQFDQMTAQKNIAVVDFYADWCGPCQVLLPIVAEIAEVYKERAEVVKVNVDNNQELALRFGVRSVPTLLFMKGDKVVDRMVGIQSKSTIEERINILERDGN